MNKPTVHDIAKEAGVSLATVDRVLNERPGVRIGTIAKVQATVERIGYVRDAYAANLARRRRYHLAFILPQGPSQFAETVKSAIAEACASPVAERVEIEIVEAPQQDPHGIVEVLRSLQSRSLDGVALMVPETPQVRDAVARLKQKGLAIVALASDLPNSNCQHFIGISSLMAGRTAARLMGRFVQESGEILVVTNSIRSRDSLERRLGFDEVMAEGFPAITVLPSVESYDDPKRMELVVGDVVRRRPRLAGIYSMGTGNTAMLKALRGGGRIGEIAVIAHELTPATRDALLADEVWAVIAQNVGHLVRSAVRVLRSLCDKMPIFEAQEQARIEILLKDNLS